MSNPPGALTSWDLQGRCLWTGRVGGWWQVGGSVEGCSQRKSQGQLGRKESTAAAQGQANVDVEASRPGRRGPGLRWGAGRRAESLTYPSRGGWRCPLLALGGGRTGRRSTAPSPSSLRPPQHSVPATAFSPSWGPLAWGEQGRTWVTGRDVGGVGECALESGREQERGGGRSTGG